MSLEDKIRDVFKENRIREATRWDPDFQPNLYELSNFLRKSGYRLVDVVELKNNSLPELLIEPIKSSYLYPEISHDLDSKRFQIDVKGHGMLDASDLEEVMKGYTNALGVVNHLNTVDLSKLEIGDRGD